MLDAIVLSYQLHYTLEFLDPPPSDILNIIICVIWSQTYQYLSAYVIIRETAGGIQVIDEPWI